MEQTKKPKRVQIGSVMKSKEDGKANYLKLNLKSVGGSLTLTDGQTLQVESKAFQLKSLANAVQKGVLSEDYAKDRKERIEKIPDFVIAEVYLINKQ